MRNALEHLEGACFGLGLSLTCFGPSRMKPPHTARSGSELVYLMCDVCKALVFQDDCYATWVVVDLLLLVSGTHTFSRMREIGFERKENTSEPPDGMAIGTITR